MSIIFIYNANSGIFNLLKDVAHKILSPKTYPCSLCDLTYNTFNENPTWKDYRKNRSSQFVFLHKDEFEIQYPAATFKYPTVLKEENGQLEPLLRPSEINKIASVEQLIQKLESLI
jgi:hypothetical protein